VIERLFRFQASSDYDSYTVHYTWHKKRRVIRQFFGMALKACGVASPTVTDIGCGDGFDVFMLSRLPEARACASFTGIDLDNQNISYCRARAQFEGADKLHFVTRDVVNSPLRPGDLGDIVICSEMVEHLPEPDEFIGQVAGALPPGGHLILTTPNAASWPARVKRALGRVPEHQPSTGPVAGHISVRGRKAWRDACRKTGLRLVRQRRGSAAYGSPQLDKCRVRAGLLIVVDAVCDLLRLNDLSWETLQLYCKPRQADTSG
jgi:2-polyprenyl-3-methyl-5-hydroxy-6-metoxy-1,4-benzoquinol methylase